MLPVSSVTSRLAVWQAPQQSSGVDPQPVDSYLAQQDVETEARRSLQGLARSQKCHGQQGGLAREFERIIAGLVDEPRYDPHYTGQERAELTEALRQVERPDADLLRRTVHLTQVLQARSQDPDVEPEVRAAADDEQFVQELRAQLTAWGKQVPPAIKLDSLAGKLARVTPDGEIHYPGTRRSSPELKAFLKAKGPEGALKSASDGTALLKELVSQGPWMSEGGSEALYHVICSQDPLVRERLEPVLDAVEQLPAQVVEAGLDRPPSASDWPGALLSAIKLRHPERIDAGLIDQIALFIGSPQPNASHRAFSDLKESCQEKPELWDYTAHVVLRRARDHGAVPGTFKFLEEALQRGWKPSSEQLAQVTGQTLAATSRLDAGLDREFDTHQVMNEGMRLLLQEPANAYPWQSALAEKTFQTRGWIMPWEDCLAPLARSYGPDRLMQELQKGASQVQRLDDLPQGLLNAVRALSDDPRLQAVLEPLLPAGCKTGSIEEIVKKSVESFQSRARPETLAENLRVEQAFDNRGTLEPTDREWGELVSRWSATEPPESRLEEVPKNFLEAASTPDDVYGKTVDLVRLKAPEGQFPAAMLLMGDILRSEKAPFPAWIAFCEAIDLDPDLNRRVQARLGIGETPPPSAGVAIGPNSVTVGNVSVRMRRRS
ncbi:MAG: hypothetical protein AMXMBFR33_62010 [Candidatus Xenobia bacterium]